MELKISFTRGKRDKNALDGNVRGARRGLYSASSLLSMFRRGDFTLHNSELLFSAVSRISNALSAMPIRLYLGTSQDFKDDLNDIVGFQPNPNMTSTMFFKTLEACRCTSGNGYALIIRNEKDEVERLDILDPSRVAPVIDTADNSLWYKVQPESGMAYYIHNHYMIHVMFLSTNGYAGVSPVSVLRDTLQYSDDVETFCRAQLEKGINAAVVLEAPANLGETQRKEMLDSFRETYLESGGNILLLESGVTAKSLNMSPLDSKMFEVEKISRSRVAMVYNMPTHLLGDYSSAAAANQEQNMLEFLQLTMLPIVTMYEQELNRKLISRADRKRRKRFEFGMDALLRADAATQARVDYQQIRSAIKTPDEARAAHGMPPAPGGIGKQLMVSQDLATLEYTIKTKPKVMAHNLQPDPPKKE